MVLRVILAGMRLQANHSHKPFSALLVPVGMYERSIIGPPEVDLVRSDM